MTLWPRATAWTLHADPDPDLPLGRGGVDRYVPWMMAPMAFLAALALAVVLVLSGFAARWDEGGGDRLTVRIPSGGNPINDALTLENVLQAMAGAPGIAAVQPVPPAEIERAVAPWIGADLASRLAFPTLVEVVLDGSDVDIPALGTELRTVAPGARIEARPAALNDLAELASAARLGALATVLVIVVAVILTVVFVARSGLAIHAPGIALLHVMGATDAYVARQFQRHLLVLTLRGAVIGVAGAVLTLLAFGLLAGDAGPDTLLPRSILGPWGWLLLLLVPPAFAAMATGTARLAVVAALNRLP